MKYVPIIMLFLLAGCGPNVPDTITKSVPFVWNPDPALFNCPQVPLPDTSTLTQKGEAQLIATLATTNRICSNNMTAIQKDLANAQGAGIQGAGATVDSTTAAGQILQKKPTGAWAWIKSKF